MLTMAASVRSVASELVVSLQPDFSAGNYGTDTTTRLLETSLNIRLKQDGYGFGVKLPYLLETGSQAVLADVGPIGPLQPTEFRHNGGGNVRLSGWVTLWRDNDAGLRLDTTLKVTPPGIPRWQALAVGFTRLDLEANLYWTITPTWDLEVDFGRRTFIGAPGLGVNNYWYSTIYLTYAVDDRWSVGLSADIQTRSSSTGTPILEMGPYVDYEIAEGWRIGAYVYRGFTRDSANIGGGMTVTRRFRF